MDNDKSLYRWVTGDYEKLFEQVYEGGMIPCFVNYDKDYRDVCRIRNTNWEFSARGISYGGSQNKEKFVKECERLNVQWLEKVEADQQEHSHDEFLQLVESIMDEYPILREYKSRGIKYDDFDPNIKRLVKSHLKIKEVTKYIIPKQ